MKGSIPTVQMVIRTFEKYQCPLTEKDVIQKVRKDFKVKTTDTTIKNCLRYLSVNLQTRTAWHKTARLSTDGHQHDRLYYNEDGNNYVLYDQANHGIWGIKILNGKFKVYKRGDSPSADTFQGRSCQDSVATGSSVSKLWKKVQQRLKSFQKPPNDSFQTLETDIRKCKLSEKCLKRNVRQFYFENDKTANAYPVMFVCHSPATRTGARDGKKRETCWQATNEDFHFNEMRRSIGLEDAYITNSLKCGTKVLSPDTSLECSNCAIFLKREIALVKPRLIITVGDKADNFLRTYVPNQLITMKVPHYSWRRRPNYDVAREKAAYMRIKQLLDDII
jgi:uracil-DNA glycosylase family 4